MNEQIKYDESEQLEFEAEYRYSDHKKLAHEQHDAEGRLHDQMRRVSHEKNRQTNPKSDEEAVKQSREMERIIAGGIPYQEELIEVRSHATESHAERSKEWADKNLEKLTKIAVKQAEADGVKINISNQAEEQ